MTKEIPLMRRDLHPINTRFLVVAMSFAFSFAGAAADDFVRSPLNRTITTVAPMTGIVFWDTSANKASDAISLEYFYAGYKDIAREDGSLDWASFEKRLNAIAARGHQAVVRFHDTYPGKDTTVPAHILARPGYKETRALSEGKPTKFPDWSHPDWKAFVLGFFEAFVKRYDRDPRLAFLEVGFGLWAEYHIYDGPFELGKTFPDFEFQSTFLKRMDEWTDELPWMISVDAADAKIAPFGKNLELKRLGFGVFDDSFLCRQHAEVNESNWNFFGRNRFERSPAGGEFSYYTRDDQRLALSPNGPHGESFEKAAARFHVTFMIGDGQPLFQPMDRIKSAGMACGYRFRIEGFETKPGRSRVRIRNVGVAPIYRSAFVAIDGVRGSLDLKSLMPGQSQTIEIEAGGPDARVSIACDHLVPGQSIPFEADVR
jgi:hypothetical protein